MRQFVFVRHVGSEVAECARIKSEGATNVPVRRSGFPGMGLAAVHEEYLPRRCRVLRAPIRVLLNALLDQSDDEVFMRVTREAMLDVMRMHDFHRIRRAKTMKANPLCRLRHNEKAPRSIAQVSSIFSQNNVA